MPPFGKMGLCLTPVFAKKGGTFLSWRSFLLRCYPWIQVENIVGISVYTGIISKSYTDYMIDRLLDALDSQYIDVKMRSLDLLIEIIKQINIPNVVIEKK